MAFTYEIVKKIATIAEVGGNSVELNIIRYGNKAPKYDLRRWRVKGGVRRMQKGITLNAEELHMLRNVLDGMGTNM